MKQIPCPHCGFQNFEISAYCGRCERPLRSLTISHMPSPTQKTPPPKPLSQPPTVSAPKPKTPPPLMEQRAHRSIPRPVPVAAPPPASLPTPPPAVPIPPAPIELSSLDPQVKEIELRVALASGWQNVKTRLFDFLTVGIIFMAILIGLILISEPYIPDNQGMLDIAADWMHAQADLLFQSVGLTFLVQLLINILFAKLGWRSLGARLSSTMLIDLQGHRLSWPKALVRTLSVFLSALPAGAGFYWAVLQPQGRTWHDLISHTVLVQYVAPSKQF